ncbi:MAG: hypothetical protein Q7S12_03595, partial [bacterium]|nr:hypothetical protein [bacterium]
INKEKETVMAKIIALDLERPRTPKFGKICKIHSVTDLRLYRAAKETEASIRQYAGGDIQALVRIGLEKQGKEKTNVVE